jgi:hypothetical protein
MKLVGRDSLVGVTIRYGLDGPGIEYSGFGGLGVCVLASGTQDRGFAPDRSRRIFHNGKIHSTQSFGLSVFRLIPEQFQTNKVHDTSKIGQKKSRWGEIFRTCPDRPWRPLRLNYKDKIVNALSESSRWLLCESYKPQNTLLKNKVL